MYLFFKAAKFPVAPTQTAIDFFFTPKVTDRGYISPLPKNNLLKIPYIIAGVAVTLLTLPLDLIAAFILYPYCIFHDIYFFFSEQYKSHRIVSFLPSACLASSAPSHYVATKAWALSSNDALFYAKVILVSGLLLLTVPVDLSIAAICFPLALSIDLAQIIIENAPTCRR